MALESVQVGFLARHAKPRSDLRQLGRTHDRRCAADASRPFAHALQPEVPGHHAIRRSFHFVAEPYSLGNREAQGRIVDSKIPGQRRKCRFTTISTDSSRERSRSKTGCMADRSPRESASTVARGDSPPADAGQQARDVRGQRPNHVAFGRGIHYCVDAPLARLETLDSHP